MSKTHPSIHRPASAILACAAALAMLAAAGTAAGAGANSVHGVVQKSDGSPVPNLGVTLERFVKGEGTSEIGGVATDDAGKFRFSGVPDGLYDVRFDERADAGLNVLRAFNPPSVYLEGGTDADVGIVNFGYADVVCRGRVVNLSRGCPEGTLIYWKMADGCFFGPAKTVADGYFNILLNGWSEAEGMIQKFRVIHKGGGVFETGVTLKPGGYVEIPLAVEYASVEGIVKDEEGKPIQGAEVFAVPAESCDLVSFSESAKSRGNGTFKLGDLPHGKWRISAYRTPWSRGYRDIEIRGTDAVKADVVVQTGKGAEVELEFGLKVEGLPLGRYIRAAYELESMPVKTAEAFRLFLVVEPEGAKSWECGLPPPAAEWPVDAPELKTTLKKVGLGKYRAHLILGVQLPRSMESPKKDDSPRTRNFSPAGWAPLHMNAGQVHCLVKGHQFEVGTTELGSGGYTFSVNQDLRARDFTPEWQLQRFMLVEGFQRLKIKKLKEEGK